MNTTSTNYYLIFKINEVLFGIDSHLVQEIVKLPEVSPLEEVPAYIRGLVNLRGKVIPVMDINLRVGRHSQIYRLSDALVVLHDNENVLGVIVNEVIEIVELPIDNVKQLSGFHDEDGTKQRLINAVARTDDGIILLLNQTQLFRFAPIENLDQEIAEVISVSDVEVSKNEIQMQQHVAFFHGMNEDEKQEFKKRAQQLKKHLANEALSDNSIALAVIKLGGEYLAIGLDATEGFAILAKLTPIPCCPPHIMGSMNLRGDNLTVVDIRGLLNIPHTKEQVLTSVMLIKCDNYSLGVPIDEIVDVVYLQSDAINRMPSTIDAMDRKYLKGMAMYAQQMLSVVDVAKLLASSELAVHEAV